MNKKANHKPRVLSKCVIIVIMLGAISLSDAGRTSGAGANDFSSRYRIIIERNIFSRQRGRRAVDVRTGRSQPTRQVAPRSPESYLVLTGLAKVNNVYVAFFEDTRGGPLIRVTAGGSLARGRVTKLNLDSVVYQRGEDSASIMVGQTLEGKLGAVALAVDSYVTLPVKASTVAGTQTAADANTPATSGDEADILKRLIERRRQELGE